MSWCVCLTNCGRPSSRTILMDENEEETESSRTILTDENEEATQSCCSRFEKWRHSKWGFLTMLLLIIIKVVAYNVHNSVLRDRQEHSVEQAELTVSKVISRSDKNKYLNIFF